MSRGITGEDLVSRYAVTGRKTDIKMPKKVTKKEFERVKEKVADE